MLSFEDTIRAVESIEKTLDTATNGWANQAAVRDIEAQVFILKTGCRDAYISEKICTIADCTGILYSPRKADKWGGSEQIKRVMTTACQSLKDWARVLEQSREDGI